jgi:type IV pilus assembly protein PilY1
VRCWGPNRVATDPVLGRSVAVVRLDTGEILQLFARSGDLPATHPVRSASPKVLNESVLLDSPMTGTPIVYPGDTGSVAQKVFLSDADGTVWKLDLSNTNPALWTLTLFFDTSNTTVDSNSATNWQDGQPIQVPMVLSLDPSGNVVLGVGTGDLESFQSTGTNYVYSISETVQGSGSSVGLAAQVNWYKTFTLGERVAGPMAVFDGVMYLATFKPATTVGCSAGAPTIWGMDYRTPQATTDLSQGGLAKLAGPNNTNIQSIDPSVNNPSVAGKVIPGVSIAAAPACADLSQTVSDQYVYGMNHNVASNVTAGSYSLLAQAGGKPVGNNPGNTATGTVSISLPSPRTVTVVDSWAAVVE